MKIKKYRLLKDRSLNGKEWKAGTIVYDQMGHDYGLASDDTHFTGIEHKSVTLNSDGDYPGFTVPVRDLFEIKDEP